jgi:hypothetical protein
MFTFFIIFVRFILYLVKDCKLDYYLDIDYLFLFYIMVIFYILVVLF